MALILNTTESSYYRVWYEKNKQRLSRERKERYANDPEFRERVKEASKRRRHRVPTPPVPPDAPFSSSQAAKLAGIGISTLREWRSKEYFPEPKHHNGALWFTEKQVLLLKNLKEFFRVYGKRPGKIKRDQLKEVVAFIRDHWD
jgi:MerR HTH family regulatory protein